MTTTDNPPLIACHDCDLLFHKRPLNNGERATCSRCGALLYKKKPDTINRTIIYSVTALILFVMANVFPFMTLHLQGLEQATLLSSGGVELFQQGFWQLGFLVLTVGIFFPFCKIMGTIYVLIPLKFNHKAWEAKTVFKLVEAISPGAMMEVLLLGVIVAYVKLTDLATISLGVSLYSFAALIVFMAITSAAFDHDEVWKRLETLP